MLDVLQRIVQEVNTAPDLKEALGIIVKRVKAAVTADVCSVYLTDFERRRHSLQATDGLDPSAVGHVEMPLNRGLIGLVCERAEPLNLDDGPTHPRYLFVAETAETPFHGFLGVPIIQNRRVLGVLVVRQLTKRKFGEAEVSFLVTLAAQLAGAITSARASGELRSLLTETHTGINFLQGRGGSMGVALGSLYAVYEMADLKRIPDRPPENIEREIDSFYAAVAAVKEDLIRLEAQAAAMLGEDDRALFRAWILMLESDTLLNSTIDGIKAGSWAAGALRDTIDEHAKLFEAMEDEYLKERASDIRDLGRRILSYLLQDQVVIREYPQRTVLVGAEVGPVQLAEVPPGRLAGVVSGSGSNSSHVAILARAMGVPAVMGVKNLPSGSIDGRRVIVDGYRGRVYVEPAPVVWAEYERVAEGDRVLSDELLALRDEPSETADGIKVPLYLNTGLISEMSALSVEIAGGVGLYRTEMPFMVRDRFPGEEAQLDNYRRVLTTFSPRPVTLRTLDIGGDKPLPYFPVEESNPFLGWRGIRICLDHPDIFQTQIRAMLRADIGYNNLRILLPMISRLEEVDDARSLIETTVEGLVAEGFPVQMPPIGVMIEVPGMVYQVTELARRVQFLSIGTNDLTQYLLAVDRNNARVADIFDEFHPAVLRAINMVAEQAKAANIELGVCGEMAGNPLATPLLLGMGVNSLSMSASSLLPVKWVVRSLSLPRARQWVKKALQQEDAGSVRRVMQQALEDMNLGGLVRSGR